MKILSLKNEENVRTMSCKQNLLGLTKKDCVSFVNNNEHYQTAPPPTPTPTHPKQCSTQLHPPKIMSHLPPFLPTYPK